MYDTDVRRQAERLAIVTKALTELAAARRETLAKVDFDVFARGLEAFTVGSIVRACKSLEAEAPPAFGARFPELHMLKARIREIEAEDAQRERERQYLPLPDDDGPRYVCLACRDGFWVLSCWCPGRGSNLPKHPRHDDLVTRDCGRRKVHAPHTWTERCACVETNPVVQQSLATQRGFVQQKAERR